MRKVGLKMNEETKYEVIKSLVDHGGNVTRAALKLGRSRSTIYRMMRGYTSSGKGFFIHGNRGRRPVHAKSDEEKSQIISLYNSKYWDANYTLASELLLSQDGITASPTLVRKLLMDERILSPMARRKTRRRMRKELNAELTEAKRKCERNVIENKIVSIKDAHARRPRCKYFGEMLQMDASIHDWFPGGKTALHLAIDDATSKIVGAYFDKQETLKGYYHVLYQILTRYGIPYMFFTDKRTVFEYKRSAGSREEDDTFTQFGYALSQLGVDLKTSSVPQAKGRAERVFGTLQGRLPILFRTAGVTTIEQANAFLNSHIKEHNAKFALNHDNILSVFEKQPTRAVINRTLAVLTKRTVDAGHAITFMSKLYRVVNSAGNPVHFRKGAIGLVIKTFDEKLFISLENRTYALDEIPERERESIRLDNTTKRKPKKRYIPPMDHPWRIAAFEYFRKKHCCDVDDKGHPPAA
jgi:transposase